MQSWVANVIGLALGFAIGGEALFIMASWRQQPSATPGMAEPVQPDPTPAPSTPQVVAGVPPIPPVELPRVLPPAMPQTDPLPRVIRPDGPPPAHKPGSGIAGTGFFVASDGTLVTAAHVVAGCAQIRIVSQWIKPAAARTLAVDTNQDIAVLRASNVRPPALLSIGRPAGREGRLFVLGYPASGGPIVPSETWAVLENAQFPAAAPAEFADPSRVIWLAAPAVAHGFSGGPMLDPRNGEVVGIVRGMVDSTRLHAIHTAIPASGMVIGPGSSPLLSLLQQEGADGDALPVSGEDAVDAARRATVHVLCLF